MISSIPKSAIRIEVLNYVTAGSNLLAGKEGAHDEFIRASQDLLEKGSVYTDEELALLQPLLLRVSTNRQQR